MSISVQCGSCDKSLKVRDELEGKRVKCPACGQPVLVAHAEPIEERPASPVKAKRSETPKKPVRSIERDEPDADEDDDAPKKKKKKRRAPPPSFLAQHKWWFVGGGAAAGLLILVGGGFLMFGKTRPDKMPPIAQVAPNKVEDKTPAPPPPPSKDPEPVAPIQPEPPPPPPEPAPPKEKEKEKEKEPPPPEPKAEPVPPPNRPVHSLGEVVHELKGHTKKVTALRFLPDGKRAITGGDDRTMRLWDLTTGEQIRQFDGGESNFVAIALDSDGKHVYSSANTRLGGLLKWNLETGAEVQRIEPKQKNLFGSLAVSSKSKRLLAGGISTTHYFDLPKGSELKTFKPAAGVGFAPLLGGGTLHMDVALSNDDRFAFVTETEANVRVYDTNTGKIVREFGDRKKNPLDRTDQWTSATFSPSAKFILSGSGGKVTLNGKPLAIDFGVRVWDVAAGKMLVHCKGHGDDVVSTALSADGKRGLSAGADNLVILWNTETGVEIGRAAGEQGGAVRVAMSDYATHALTGSKDGTVRLWKLSAKTEGDPVAQAPPPSDAPELFRYKAKYAKGAPSKKVKVYEQDDGKIQTSVLGDDGVIGFAQDGPNMILNVLIPGSTEIQVTVNRELGYTTVADLRFADDAIVDLPPDGTVRVQQAGIRASDAAGTQYISVPVAIGGRNVFAMAKKA